MWRTSEADERKLGHESTSRCFCAVVGPPDKPAQNAVDHRKEIAVALLVVGEHGLGLGQWKLSVDGGEPFRGDRDLYWFAYLNVAVPLSGAAQAGDDDQLVLGSVLCYDLQHRSMRSAGDATDVRQSQESAAEQPAEVAVVQKRGSPQQAAQQRSGSALPHREHQIDFTV